MICAATLAVPVPEDHATAYFPAESVTVVVMSVPSAFSRRIVASGIPVCAFQDASR
jgi:hypothetical protein